MQGLGRALGPIFIAGSFCVASAVYGEQQFGTMEDITFFYPDDFACGQSVIIALKAESSAPFADPSVMSKVASQLAAAMAFDCAEAENIKMEGFVGDELVYTAITSKGSDWAVMVRVAPEPPEDSSDASAGDTASASGGVLPTLPSAESTQADAQTPETQPAGTGNKAMDRLSSIGTSSAELSEKEGLESVDYSIFSQAKLIEAFHGGDLDIIDRKNNSVFFYINGFNKFFANKVNFIDQSCLRLFDPSLDKSTLKVMYGNVVGGGSPEEQGLQALEEIFTNIVRMRERGVEGMIDDFGAVDVLLQQGERDAAVLADEYTCGGDFAKVVYFNMSAFVNRTPPRMSPRVISRKKIEAAQENISASCEDRFGGGQFCGCLIEGMQSIDISVEAWEEAGADLANLAHISSDPMVARNIVRACNQ